MESVFIIVIGGLIGHLKLLEMSSTKNAFLGIFRNIQNNSFANIP